MRKILLMAACLLGASVATAQAQSSDAILDRINQKKQISIGYREASVPADVIDAHQRLDGIAIHTPLLRSDELDARTAGRAHTIA
jgi:hypothetical protein